MKIGLFILLLSIPLNIQNTFCQESSKNILTYGCGTGISDGSGYVGGGLAMTLGYKRDLWKDRLRLNPNLMIGAYRSEGVMDVREQYFNSVSLRLSVDYDLIRYRAFSINLETGGLINATRGLMGTGGEFGIRESEYVNYWNYALIMAGGLRIAPQNSNIAIKIMPLNIHMGLNYFAEVHAMVILEMRLKL